MSFSAGNELDQQIRVANCIQSINTKIFDVLLVISTVSYKLQILRCTRFKIQLKQTLSWPLGQMPGWNL